MDCYLTRYSTNRTISGLALPRTFSAATFAWKVTALIFQYNSILVTLEKNRPIRV